MSLPGIIPLAQGRGLKIQVYEALRELIGHMDIYSSKNPIRLDERALGEQLGLVVPPYARRLHALNRKG